tara:strand:+ start:203 stop:1753 length:1551 start_codon:yes stop_codon:yes gene_type:complete
MSDLKWWETAIIYQIYPRSFQDSNADGIGDLQGITSRLDYISNLGVDAIWISPFFKSPQKDFGYDVSDYFNIAPEFGDLKDLERLISKAHALDLKVMLDIVAAHCSDQHPYFEESRQSKDNSKADWYHWLDPMPDGTPPTNWLSFFGGNAWSWEPRRQQYYLHNFLASQPNFNFSNPEVLDYFDEIARFWFEFGVDGFRLDAVHTINADKPPFKNNLPNPEFSPGPLPLDRQPFFRQLHDYAQLNQPSIQAFCSRMRQVSDSYNDRFLMGEVDGDNDDAMKVSKIFTQTGRLHATYNFDLLEWDGLTIEEMKEVIDNAVETFNDTGKLCFAFSNHDVPRSVSRQISRLNLKNEDSEKLQLLLLKLESCLIGSACIYQGEELGFEDVTDIPIEKMQDPWGIEFAYTFQGRDTCRTPMVWDATSPNGGFTEANQTWLPIGKQHYKRDALGEVKKEGSIYNSFSRFLAWRKKQPAFMDANNMTKLSGSQRQITFNRISNKQILRCCFDFDTLTASFQEI